MTTAENNQGRNLLVRGTLFAAVLATSWYLIRLWGPLPVEVTHPRRGPAVQAVYATGTVEPLIMMPIATRSSARLMELNVDEGSDVTKDQILARLENEDLQSALSELKAKEQFARKEYNRYKEMMEGGASSRQAFDRAKSEWEAAKAATAKAQTQSNFMNLIAPADGHIIRRDGEIGQLIPANTPVFWISCSTPLRISAEVDEEDITLVKVEQPVVIRADAFPGKIFHGKVKSITPKGDPIARSYRVRVELTEETPLQIGMTAETNIIISQREDALLLPKSAVEGSTLWKVVDGRLKRQPVTLGARGLNQVEIVAGVTPDDIVVIMPLASFTEGARVRQLLTKQEG